jgi:CheY-like chemotaxis protein
MDAEQLDRIFDPFTQIPGAQPREHGGTGLGLSICRRLCHLMGGDISAQSKPGEGSTFTVRIKAQVTRSGEPEKQPEEPVLLRAEGSTADDQRPVLIIDDETSSRDLMTRVLSRYGLPVVTASSGEEGLALARKHRPLVILLDVVMPGMDGWMVLTALKTDSVLSDIPVIMTTIVENEQLGYTLGASDYLVKPIDRQKLVETVNRYRQNAGEYHVLVVEDEPDTRDLVYRTLSKEGIRVTAAGDGQQAMGHMHKQPDVVLLDLMMPNMDGFQFVEEVRKTDAWREVPIIVLTAKDLTHEERRRLNGCVQRIIQKSTCDWDQLLVEIRRLARRHQGLTVTP